MTDNIPDPTDPKARRSKRRREPATLDLKAVETGEEQATAPVGTDPLPPWSDVTPVPGPDAVPTPVTAPVTADAPVVGSDTPRPRRSRVWPQTLSETPAPEPDPGASAAGQADADETAPVEPPAPRPDRVPGSRGPALSGLLAAALVGGLLGGGAVLAFGLAGGRLGGVDPRFQELSQTVGAAAPREALTALERRLATLEGQAAGFDERLRGLQTTTERTAQALQQEQSRPVPSPAPPQDPAGGAALSAVASRLAALESQVQSRQAAGGEATATLERRLADQDQRLTALAQRLAESGPDVVRAGLTAIVAGRVRDSLAAGEPFADGLALLRRLGTDEARLTALEPFAAQGARVATLAAEWREAAARAASGPDGGAAPQPGGLWALAGRLVTVTPVDRPDAGSDLGTVEAALSAGRTEDAARAFDALPEAVRQATGAMGARIRALATAEAAARALDADALDRLQAAIR